MRTLVFYILIDIYVFYKTFLSSVINTQNRSLIVFLYYNFFFLIVLSYDTIIVFSYYNQLKKNNFSHVSHTHNLIVKYRKNRSVPRVVLLLLVCLFVFFFNLIKTNRMTVAKIHDTYAF